MSGALPKPRDDVRSAAIRVMAEAIRACPYPPTIETLAEAAYDALQIEQVGWHGSLGGFYAMDTHVVWRNSAIPVFSIGALRETPDSWEASPAPTQ